jgi:hypothetical protein
MSDLTELIVGLVHWALPPVALLFFLICLAQLARRRKWIPQQAFLFSVITRDKLPLERCENSVGRSPRCDVVLNYPTISRFHAVIALRREGWVLFDTNSHGGTKVDGMPLEQRKILEHGQRIDFGNMEYIFCQEAAAAQSEARRLEDENIWFGRASK